MTDVYYFMVLLIALSLLQQFVLYQLILGANSQNYDIVQKNICLNFWIMTLISILFLLFFYFQIKRNSLITNCVVFFVLICIVIEHILSAKLFGNVMINFDEIARNAKWIQVPMFFILGLQILFIVFSKLQTKKSISNRQRTKGEMYMSSKSLVGAESVFSKILG